MVLAAYVGNIVVANWTATYWSPLVFGSVAMPAGTLGAGLGFSLRDLVHEGLGGRGVLGAIAVGAGLSWLLASPRIAVASVLAFTTSELVGSLVYEQLRGRSVLGAVIGSNMVGLGIDSVLFVPLAFGGFALLPGQLIGKTVATVLTVAVLVGVNTARRVVRGRGSTWAPTNLRGWLATWACLCWSPTVAWPVAAVCHARVGRGHAIPVASLNCRCMVGGAPPNAPTSLPCAATPPRSATWTGPRRWIT